MARLNQRAGPTVGCGHGLGTCRGYGVAAPLELSHTILQTQQNAACATALAPSIGAIHWCHGLADEPTDTGGSRSMAPELRSPSEDPRGLCIRVACAKTTVFDGSLLQTDFLPERLHVDAFPEN